MRQKRDVLVRVIAGSLAIASGVAYLAYVLPFEGRDGAITAWNLLIIPATMYLGGALAWRGPIAAAVSTAAGVTASLLWAFAYRSPALESWWIGLAAVWWLGIGWLLLSEHRALGRFTLLLGVATIIDLVVTVMNAPMPLYMVGGFKIPLTMAWTFWIGLTLVRDPRWGAQPVSGAGQTRWAGATALLGGLLWALLAAGWTFSHGSTESPRGATLLAFGPLEFTRLLAVPAGLWLVSLVRHPARTARDGRPAARYGVAIALLGAAMVGLGAILQTSIVDPNLDFGHPAVQGGWLLYIAGLVPVLTAGMLVVGLATSPTAPAVRRATVLIALLLPLDVVAFFLSGVSDGGQGWDVALAIMHGAPGLGWIALGSVLLSHRDGEQAATLEPI